MDTRVARFVTMYDVDYAVAADTSITGNAFRASDLFYGTYHDIATGTTVQLDRLRIDSGDRYHVAAMYDSARFMRLAVTATPRVLPALAGNHVVSFISCWDRYGRDFPDIGAPGGAAAYAAAVTGDYSQRQTTWTSGGSARSHRVYVTARDASDRTNFMKVVHNADGTVQMDFPDTGEHFLPDLHTIIDLGLRQPVATTIRIRFEVSVTMMFRGRHGSTGYTGISPVSGVIAADPDAPVLVKDGGGYPPGEEPLLGPFEFPIMGAPVTYYLDSDDLDSWMSIRLPRVTAKVETYSESPFVVIEAFPDYLEVLGTSASPGPSPTTAATLVRKRIWLNQEDGELHNDMWFFPPDDGRLEIYRYARPVDQMTFGQNVDEYMTVVTLWDARPLGTFTLAAHSVVEGGRYRLVLADSP